MLKHLLAFSRIIVTAVVVVGALIALRYLWDRYELDPWTRDGRVRADTVQVACHQKSTPALLREADNAGVDR